MAFILNTLGIEVNFNIIDGLSTKKEVTLVIDIVPVSFGITNISGFVELNDS